MGETDQVLVAKVRAGNHSAFRILVERWSRSVFRVAFRMTGNESDAEDIAQETFLKAYRQLDHYESRAAFGTWIYRIAVNCSLDLLRVRDRHCVAELPEITSTAPAPDRLALSGEFRDRLGRALELLSHQERAAFLLRHYEGLPIEEIAQALELSGTATKNSIFRAVQKLRVELQPLCNTSTKKN